MLKKTYLSIIAAVPLMAPISAHAGESLVIANYGGAWAKTLDEVCVKPFTAETGITVTQSATDDSAAQIKVQQMTGNVLWDISPTEGSTLFIARDNNWLEPIDWKVVDPDSEIIEQARNEFAIGSVAYSTALGFRTDKLPAGETVKSWKDFWDTKKFPGPRSLRNSPVENLEFALIADGVELADIYKVLDTPEGVDRAFKKLDEIKGDITVWWTSGQQPVQLLASGDAYYATAFNGRIGQLQADKVPVDYTFNGASLDVSYYSIQKGAKNLKAALQFMKYCWNSPERLAKIAELMPYSGFNPKLFDKIDPSLANKLPTAPGNLSQQFYLNGSFWAKHRPEIQARWDEWILQ